MLSSSFILLTSSNRQEFITTTEWRSKKKKLAKKSDKSIERVTHNDEENLRESASRSNAESNEQFMKNQFQNTISINQIDEKIADNSKNVDDQFLSTESQKSNIKNKSKKKNDEDIQKSLKKIDLAKTFKKFNRAN